jgi:hypothetical protein
LEPWDFIDVPKGQSSTFKNIGDADGALLVIIQGSRDSSTTCHPPYVAQQLEERFGADVVAKLDAEVRHFFSPRRHDLIRASCRRLPSGIGGDASRQRHHDA